MADKTTLVKVLAFVFAVVITAIGILTYVNNVTIEVTEEQYFFPGVLVFFGGFYFLIRSYVNKKLDYWGVFYTGLGAYIMYISKTVTPISDTYLLGGILFVIGVAMFGFAFVLPRFLSEEKQGM